MDIADRPSIVDTRSRIGDWEADTVIGKNHQGAILTLIERKSRLYLALPIKRKTAQASRDAIIELLSPIKNLVHTITFDNGREFNRHGEIAKQLNCNTYFAKPCHSWERESNENHNGLLRQFFPKKMKLDKITDNAVKTATDLMNNRPRKCLGFKTPFEVFAEMMEKNYFFKHRVALMG